MGIYWTGHSDVVVFFFRNEKGTTYLILAAISVFGDSYGKCGFTIEEKAQGGKRGELAHLTDYQAISWQVSED